MVTVPDSELTVHLPSHEAAHTPLLFPQEMNPEGGAWALITRPGKESLLNVK